MRVTQPGMGTFLAGPSPMVNQEGPRLKSSGCDSISPPSNVQNRRTQHSRRETEAQRGMGLISGHPRLLATSPTSSPLWLRQSVVCAKLWHPAPTNPHQPPGFPLLTAPSGPGLGPKLLSPEAETLATPLRMPCSHLPSISQARYHLPRAWKIPQQRLWQGKP